MHAVSANLSARAAGNGFSLLELVVVIVLIGILLAVALDRLLGYVEEAERVAVLRVEGQIRSSLVLEAAQRIVRGESQSLSGLEGSNPMQLMLDAPPNYAGEIDSQQASPAPGHWYFDRRSGRLVYRIGERFGFDRDRIMENPQFEVRVEYEDRNTSGRYEASEDNLIGVRLHRAAGIDWLTGGKRF